MLSPSASSAASRRAFTWTSHCGVTATVLALFGVLIFPGAGPLKSYVLSTAGPGGPVIKWPVNTSIVLPLQLGTHGQGTLLDGSANFDVVAAEAAGLWDDYLGSNVRFIPTQNGVGPSGTTYNATSNQVLFSDTINGMAFNPAVLAVTTTYYNRFTGTINRSDVTFNNMVSWNSFRGASSGSGTTYDLSRVAVHEFGHALGLAHPDAQMVVAIMNSRYSDTIEVPQQDDINGIQADYGLYNPLPNLISHGTRNGRHTASLAGSLPRSSLSSPS